MALRSKRWLFLGLALLVFRAMPIHAQEQVTLQLSGTGSGAADPQLRGINTWLDQGNPTTGSHNGDTSLAIQSVSTGGTVAQRAFLLFDTSRIPRSGIKSATVQVYLNSISGADIPLQWEIDPVTSFVASPLAYAISWDGRSNQLSWTSPGGDFTATDNTISTGTTNNSFLPTWDVTSTVKTWFGGYPPSPNYGFIIKDPRETSNILFGPCNGTAGTDCDFGLIASSADSTTSHRPAMVVQFIQEVQNLTATPGSASVVLNWTYPAAVANGTTLNATTGVVIVRNAGAPVPNSALFTDGAALPTACSTSPNGSGASVVVVASTTTATGTPTTFSDPGTCTAPANGTTYFYKVFAVAKIGATTNFNYSTNGTGALAGVDNSFVAEISATPGVGTAAQAPSWIAPVQAATLAPAGIDPSNFVLATTNNSLVQGFNPANGNDAFAPISISGAVSSRMPVLEANEEDWGPANLGRAVPMTYLADQDNLVYDVELASPGVIGDFLNPVPVNGAFTGGIALQAKAFSNSGNTKPNDVMIMGTHIAGTNTTTNMVFAAVTCNLSVANPTGTGCFGSGGGGWNIQGGSGNGLTSLGCGTGPATCLMDIITSTPFIDYANNIVWVTSHNDGDSGASANLPDVWKLDANNGTVLAAINLGSNIDSSPSMLPNGAGVIVGTNNGSLYAFDAVATTAGPPTVPTQLSGPTVSLGDGAIKGFPVMANSSSPFTIIVSTNTRVTAYSFVSGTGFTQLWSTAMGCNPSTPLTVPGLQDAASHPVVYVGCSDGKLHELLLSTGVDETQRIVDTTSGVVVGDPTLDTTLNKVIVGASDGRVYAFAFPF